MMNTKLKLSILSIVLSFWSHSTQAQMEVTWADLAHVKYESQFFEDYDDYFLVPNFFDEVRALDGKEISIKGYFLDIFPGENIFLISSNPMSSCFFCGAAGPETVIELSVKKADGIKTDDIITATGTFVLNEVDVEHCNYILKDVKIEKTN